MIAILGSPQITVTAVTADMPRENNLPSCVLPNIGIADMILTETRRMVFVKQLRNYIGRYLGFLDCLKQFRS